MDLVEFKNIFNDSEIIDNKLVIKSNLFGVIGILKNDYKFEILKDILAIDNQKDGIELIYHLYSIINDENLSLSITITNEIDSISKIFDSAVADEKEIYDLFGVKFIGNVELKRIYLPESWIGHPLKKDYILKDERLNWND